MDERERLARLEADVEHLDQDLREAVKELREVRQALQENNLFLSRSKGMIAGAGILISAIWALILGAVLYFKDSGN